MLDGLFENRLFLVTSTAKTPLRAKSRIHYSNVIVLSNSGKMLSTIVTDRAEWCLQRELAREAKSPEGYPRSIQLNFQNKHERAGHEITPRIWVTRKRTASK
jgi:hypothetical protein